jgi:hypothetical protein
VIWAIKILSFREVSLYEDGRCVKRTLQDKVRREIIREKFEVGKSNQLTA